MNREVNATFLTLTPKVQTLLVLHDYRPISVVGCIYKFLSKVLANRLKQVLDIMSSFEGSFVGTRHILGGIFVANQLIDYSKSMSRGCEF